MTYLWQSGHAFSSSFSRCSTLYPAAVPNQACLSATTHTSHRTPVQYALLAPHIGLIARFVRAKCQAEGLSLTFKRREGQSILRCPDARIPGISRSARSIASSKISGVIRLGLVIESDEGAQFLGRKGEAARWRSLRV